MHKGVTCVLTSYISDSNITHQKNICNVKNWPVEPPKSVEIRNQIRAYNSNPLQHHEHVQYITS